MLVMEPPLRRFRRHQQAGSASSTEPVPDNSSDNAATLVATAPPQSTTISLSSSSDEEDHVKAPRKKRTTVASILKLNRGPDLKQQTVSATPAAYVTASATSGSTDEEDMKRIEDRLTNVCRNVAAVVGTESDEDNNAANTQSPPTDYMYQSDSFEYSTSVVSVSPSEHETASAGASAVSSTCTNNASESHLIVLNTDALMTGGAQLLDKKDDDHDDHQFLFEYDQNYWSSSGGGREGDDEDEPNTSSGEDRAPAGGTSPLRPDYIRRQEKFPSAESVLRRAGCGSPDSVANDKKLAESEQQSQGSTLPPMQTLDAHDVKQKLLENAQHLHIQSVPTSTTMSTPVSSGTVSCSDDDDDDDSSSSSSSEDNSSAVSKNEDGGKSCDLPIVLNVAQDESPKQETTATKDTALAMVPFASSTELEAVTSSEGAVTADDAIASISKATTCTTLPSSLTSSAHTLEEAPSTPKSAQSVEIVPRTSTPPLPTTPAEKLVILELQAQIQSMEKERSELKSQLEEAAAFLPQQQDLEEAYRAKFTRLAKAVLVLSRHLNDQANSMEGQVQRSSLDLNQRIKKAISLLQSAKSSDPPTQVKALPEPEPSKAVAEPDCGEASEGSAIEAAEEGVEKNTEEPASPSIIGESSLEPLLADKGDEEQRIKRSDDTVGDDPVTPLNQRIRKQQEGADDLKAKENLYSVLETPPTNAETSISRSSGSTPSHDSPTCSPATSSDENGQAVEQQPQHLSSYFDSNGYYSDEVEDATSQDVSDMTDDDGVVAASSSDEQQGPLFRHTHEEKHDEPFAVRPKNRTPIAGRKKRVASLVSPEHSQERDSLLATEAKLEVALQENADLKAQLAELQKKVSSSAVESSAAPLAKPGGIVNPENLEKVASDKIGAHPIAPVVSATAVEELHQDLEPSNNGPVGATQLAIVPADPADSSEQQIQWKRKLSMALKEKTDAVRERNAIREKLVKATSCIESMSKAISTLGEDLEILQQQQSECCCCFNGRLAGSNSQLQGGSGHSEPHLLVATGAFPSSGGALDGCKAGDLFVKKNEYDQLAEERDCLQVQLDKLTEEHKAVADKHTSLEAKLRNTEQSSDQFRTDATRRLESLGAELKVKAAQLQTKQIEVDSSQQRRDLLQAKCDKLREYVETMASKCDQWESYCEQQMAAMEALKLANDNARSKTLDMQKKYQNQQLLPMQPDEDQMRIINAVLSPQSSSSSLSLSATTARSSTTTRTQRKKNRGSLYCELDEIARELSAVNAAMI